MAEMLPGWPDDAIRPTLRTPMGKRLKAPCSIVFQLVVLYGEPVASHQVEAAALVLAGCILIAGVANIPWGNHPDPSQGDITGRSQR